MRCITALVSERSSDQFRAEMARTFGAVRTATAKDLPRIDVVVCGDWEKRKKPQAIRATCADCGRSISHMPWAPVGPPKICGACLHIRMEP